MPITHKSGTMRPTKPVVLKDNFQLPVCFSGVAYPVTNVVCRPNGVDFTFQGKTFKDIDFWEKGIEWVSSQNV